MNFIRAVRFKDDVAVIERAYHGVALGKAETDVRARSLRRLGELLKLRLTCDDGCVIIALPVLAAVGVALAHAEAEVHPDGIARYEQLRENYEVGLLRGGLVNVPQRLFKSRGLIKHHRLSLYQCYPASALNIFHN